MRIDKLEIVCVTTNLHKSYKLTFAATNALSLTGTSNTASKESTITVEALVILKVILCVQAWSEQKIQSCVYIGDGWPAVHIIHLLFPGNCIRIITVDECQLCIKSLLVFDVFLPSPASQAVHTQLRTYYSRLSSQHGRPIKLIMQLHTLCCICIVGYLSNDWTVFHAKDLYTICCASVALAPSAIILLFGLRLQTFPTWQACIKRSFPHGHMAIASDGLCNMRYPTTPALPTYSILTL